MSNAPWQIFLGLHAVMLLFTLGAQALGGQGADWSVVTAGMPWTSGAADLDAAWDGLSFNPLSIVGLIFTFIRSIFTTLIGLLTLDYAILAGEGWLGAVGLGLRAVSGVSAAVYGIQLITQVRS